jgi:hypothetical protein
MNDSLIRAKLVEVLQTIQVTSNLDCPDIVGSTKPLEALPQFDSKIWPVAVGMLAAELGITIADDVNIFRRPNTCIALTVDEIVETVAALVDLHVSVVSKKENVQ